MVWAAAPRMDTARYPRETVTDLQRGAAVARTMRRAGSGAGHEEGRHIPQQPSPVMARRTACTCTRRRMHLKHTPGRGVHAIAIVYRNEEEAVAQLCREGASVIPSGLLSGLTASPLWP